ncbi:SDR family NAD(P)-dependent oxidoreductase [Sphingobium sp. YR768]|uniref:SDR family NAD(P)-dependent oxidoreductase n=1 Tax=Sphingobium sp. YR768 TaxID=1884365 RepID=UPI0008BFAC80|nr:SDR family NAD(P)-dependent oxidoreductase [Sphingobium sp. YR768]SER69479.1 Short-chain dehydrogenase [Sphingobium sp. YR768]
MAEGRVAGRRIIVTGAASGIGLATARLLAREGATLSLLDRDKAALAEIAGELRAHHAQVNLPDETAIDRAVRNAALAMGGIDGLVNVAGIGGMGRLADLTLADWNRTIGVNLTGPMLLMRAVLPHLEAAGQGTIVNIASGQGLTPSAPGMAAYCASKGGLVTLSKALALELAPTIRVNCVCPGVVDTPLLPDAMRAAAREPGSPYALKRVGEAEEVAAAILFLTSAESAFITGIAMAVDGGRTYH